MKLWVKYRGSSWVGWAKHSWPAVCILPALGLVLFHGFSGPVRADDQWTGRRIMDESFKRHELFPYVFEAQTMILKDSAGNRDVRRARRFSRVEKDGTVKYLLVFDQPVEVRGVALLAIRLPSGRTETMLYLPALGRDLISYAGDGRGSQFLGTDFAVEDLTAEVLTDFRYVREADQKFNKVDHFALEAFPQDEKIERMTGYSLRRHFVRKDNFFVVRTYFFDRRGRFFKKMTLHDLKRVDGDMWRANMILMEDLKERHKTLIKIDRRVFSHDYVPSEMFTPEWLLGNRHILVEERRLPRGSTDPTVERIEALPDAH